MSQPDLLSRLARSCISYTNHTLLPEALEQWPLDMFKAVLPRHFQIIEQIDNFFVEELKATQCRCGRRTKFVRWTIPTAWRRRTDG